MAGTTTNYSLPYPEPTDLVAAYPALGQDLAEDLDTILANKANIATPTFTGTSEVVVTAHNTTDGDWTTTAVILKSGTTNPANLKISGQRQMGKAGIFSVAVSDVTGSINERLVMSDDGRIKGSGKSLGAWTAWTPTLSGFGLGNGSMDARYNVIGKTCIVFLQIVFGSTSSFGSGAEFKFTLPFQNTGVVTSLGGQLVDQSTGRQYEALLDWASANEATVESCDASWNLARNFVHNDFPFAWTTSDILQVAGLFETV